MKRIIGFLTDILSWIVKNANMLVGIITAITKLVVAFINIFQPSKDNLVDTIEGISEKIQSAIYKASDFLKKFNGSTK